MNPEEVAAALQRILRLEISLYKEVRELSRSQLDYIERSDSNGLMRVVGEKQNRIAKIEELEVQGLPLKQQREASLESWPQIARDMVDPLIRQLQAILTEIVALEDQARSAAENFTRDSGEKVRKIQTGKAMLNAYGKSLKGGSFARYKDKQG